MVKTYTLAMAVSDLLDLERSLETRRELVAAAHDEERLLGGKRVLGELLKGLVLLEDARDLARKVVETVDDGLAALELAERVVRELNGHHDEGLVRE